METILHLIKEKINFYSELIENEKKSLNSDFLSSFAYNVECLYKHHLMVKELSDLLYLLEKIEPVVFVSVSKKVIESKVDYYLSYLKNGGFCTNVSNPMTNYTNLWAGVAFGDLIDFLEYIERIRKRYD